MEKWQHVPNALSRHASPNTEKQQASIAALASKGLSETDEIATDNQNKLLVVASFTAINTLTSSLTIQQIQDATSTDKLYQELLNIMQTGFPTKRNQPIFVHSGKYMIDSCVWMGFPHGQVTCGTTVFM